MMMQVMEWRDVPLTDREFVDAALCILRNTDCGPDLKTVLLRFLIEAITRRDHPVIPMAGGV